MGNFIRKFIGLLSFLSFLSFTNGNAQTNVSGVISSNSTWSKINSPYKITGNVQVNSGITLTIEPGVQVVFQDNFYLKILGTINSVGTVGDSIIFKSSNSNNWAGILLVNSSTTLNSDFTYASGSIFKYNSFKSSSKALFVYNSGFYIENCKFQDNTIGFEPRASSKGLLKSTTFLNNTTGIYTEYEDNTTGYGVSCIKDFKLQGNLFELNTTGANLNMNQRTFDNLQVVNNIFSSNSTGLTLGGGGYGPYLANVLISNNNFTSNTNGLNISNIYSNGYNGCTGTLSFPLIIEKNLINNNSSIGLSFSYSGNNHTVRNNIIDSNSVGISITGTTSSVSFQKNSLFENKKTISVNGSSGYEPSSLLFSTNTFKNSSVNSSDYTILNNVTNNSNKAIANNFIDISNIFLVKNINRGQFNLESNYVKLPSGVSSVNDLIYDINDDVSLGEVVITTPSNTLTTTAPLNPVHNVTKNLTGSGIVLTWSANTESDVSGYKIYYGGYTGYSYTNSVDVGNVTSTTVSAGIGIDENFAVTAYDASKDGTDDQFDGNESWYSTANKIPNAPTNLVAVSSGHKVKLNWDVSTSSGVNNYNIYRSTDGVSFTKLISTTNSTYTNTGLTAYTKYYYKVASFDSLDLSYDSYGIESALSSAVNAIPTNIFYVDSAIGIDITGFGSLLNPYKTIQTAIDLTIAGDTVYVKPGTYKEQLSITKGITVESTDGASKTIILQEALLDRNVNINNNFASPYLQVNIKGFKFLQTKVNRNQLYGINVEKKSFAKIESCYFEGFNVALKTYYGYYNVKNSVFYDNDIIAMNDVGDSDVFPIFQNCTIVNTSQVIANSTTVLHRIYNTIIVNDKSKIYNGTPLGGGTKIPLYNVIMDTLLKDYSAADGSTIYSVNRAEDMKFTNLILKDFSLSNASPAIGIGNTTLSNITDFLGALRPNPASSLPDLGAYESIYDHPSPFITSDSSIDGVIMFKVSQVPSGTVNKFSIYRGLTTLPTSKYLDTTLINRYIDNSNTDYNKIIYYRLTSTGASNLASGYSDEIRTIAFTPPILGDPANLLTKVDTNYTFKWSAIDNATNYKLQYSTDPTFVANVVEVSKSDNAYIKVGLADNTSYYWRVKTLDSIHASKWSNSNSFQTFVRKPVLASITSTNKSIILNWTVNSIRNIKSFKIYKGTATNPTTKVDSISSSNLSYTDPVENGNIFYYRVTAINTDNIESDYSNEMYANSFGITVLSSPVNSNTKESLTPSFKWDAINLATLYNIQISTDSLFISTPVIDTITSLNSFIYYKGLTDNSTYYWRVRVGDSKGYGNWTARNTFQTLVLSPKLLSIQTGNKVDTLKWSVANSNNLKYFKIYSDTINNPTKLKDSISGALSTYIDKTNLQLNIKYYYRIIAGNQQNIESDYSNILSATPINTLPKAIKLVNKTVQNSGEYNFVKLSYSGSGSYDLDGSIASYNWYVNDSLVNSKDSILSYFFKLGTNTIKLVVIDNDGGKDTSSSILNLTALQKQFQSGILGGISAINQNYILTADTSYNSITGSSVSLLDRLGNTIIPIVVQSKIFTTPSVSSDSSIFITNGSSLNGYSKVGVSLWPTIPLGGISYVTPTIDSNLSRIYVGVSNKNFFAYDYKTGKNVWSIICDAPINTSAVISGDRKLIFTSQTGTLYGFDISKSDVQTTPKWKMSFGDIITKSPAIDANSNIYVGTDAGRLIKFQLNADGTVTVKWNVTLNSSIQTSPVIDADGNIYVGTEKGDFYKIDRLNGTTIWSYNVGAAIHSTPNISEYGTIYVSNMNGLVTAMNTNKLVLWTYQDIAAISANSLYINNMLYIASEKGTFTGIYDNPNSVNVNTSFASSDKSSITSFGSSSPKSNITSNGLPTIVARPPVWGTFQGDYRRTGNLSLVCPSSLAITKDVNGSLISNTPNYIQWYKDGSAILNAEDVSYKPTIAGSYSIKNNQAGCNVISSNSYYYIVTDVININNEEFIKVNPNPILNFANFEFKVKGYQFFNLEIFSLSTGNKIASKQNIRSGDQISLSTLSAGVYMFRLSSSDNKLNYQFKMVKL